MEVRGARLNRAGVELLVDDRSESRRSAAGRKKSSERGSPLPPDDKIESMMKALIAGGLRRDVAAKQIRNQPGYEAVTNEHARRVVANKLPRGRRTTASKSN